MITQISIINRGVPGEREFHIWYEDIPEGIDIQKFYADFEQYLKAYDPSQKGYLSESINKSWLIGVDGDGKLEISDEFAEAIMEKLRRKIEKLLMEDYIVETYRELLIPKGEIAEKPKEQRQVWTCAKCGHDLFYELEIKGYFHIHNSCSWCDPSGKLNQDNIGIPEPDSEKWVRE